MCSPRASARHAPLRRKAEAHAVASLNGDSSQRVTNLWTRARTPARGAVGRCRRPVHGRVRGMDTGARLGVGPRFPRLTSCGRGGQIDEAHKHEGPGLHPALRRISATRADRPASLTPSKVQVLPAAATGESPRQQLPPVRFGAPRSVHLRQGDGTYWVVPNPPRTSVFPPCPARYFPCRRPRLLSQPVHPPTSLSVPYRVLQPAACPPYPEQPCDHSEAGKRLPWGPVPLRDVNQPQPPSAQSTQLHATVRPRRSSRPRRFHLRPALRVCFTPQPRPGFALQGVVPPGGAVPGFPGHLPSCPSSKQTCKRAPAPASLPRTSGPCSPPGMRWCLSRC
jgi:hypothetical protein